MESYLCILPFFHIWYQKNKIKSCKFQKHCASKPGNELSEDTSQNSNEERDTLSNSGHTVVVKQPINPRKRPRSNIKCTLERSDIKAAVNELKELSNSLTMSIPSASEDEFDVIGRHVTLQLRQLPPIDRIDMRRMKYRQYSLNTVRKLSFIAAHTSCTIRVMDAFETLNITDNNLHAIPNESYTKVIFNFNLAAKCNNRLRPG
ncbi:unnamed protein product [Parnassius apollo]|uniref:(apollo) hypothetical protein n=1 Tax=Parnassius apollo TaxID=110799 RepID=A0A8S3W395_PARAO|nr:unnamed protein product [Parnassius apollo]